MLTVPDRDQLPWLPQIALHQLTRPINRPLERPLDQEPRADLPNVIVEDRLPALIADLASKLPQPLRLDPRISLKLLADPVLERIELRPDRRPLVPRRHRRGQQPRDRVTVQPRPPADLPARQPLDPVHPPHLSPLLHADHLASSSPDLDDRASVEGRPDASGPAPGGLLFDRRR